MTLFAAIPLLMICFQPCLGQRCGDVKPDHGGEAMMRLDLVCPRASLPRLARRLERDAIRLVDIDSSTTGPAVARVELRPRRFSALFNPMMVTRLVARSADSGFSERQYLERYSIPARYRGLITEVRLPDPQIE